MPIGLIGGSGMYEIEGLAVTKEVSVSTPFGPPSCSYKLGMMGDSEVVFLSRHGTPHSIPPHLVNYRANIWGFKALGVDRVISVNATGAINRDIPLGSLVLQDQLLDMTGGSRKHTFYEDGKVFHVDFTNPYCAEMREKCIAAAAEINLPVRPSAAYVCVNGPRLETALEIRFYASVGADIVGMTAMPEAALARELEICMLGISAITNYAAGILDKKLTATEVVENMRCTNSIIKNLIAAVISRLGSERTCTCKNALKNAGL
jgi:5'-methylthioadenosine phosphorylase